MATRRDQLQSYQFLTRRVIAAFVMRETDPAASPLRRGIGAMFAGLMVAVLISAGFGIYGLLTKIGGDEWRTDGAVVVERETGASFVYAGGTLHPTLNLASARLASGSPDQTVHRVAAGALAQVPRGVTIGIPGAPDSLPAASELVGLPWTFCAASGDTGEVTMVVAGAPGGGRPLGDAGLLVRDLAGRVTYLLWHGAGYRLRDPELVVPALFGAVVAPVPVGAAWLNALPTGADLGPIPVDGRGGTSSAVSARTNGDLLVADTGSGPQHYLVLDDGLAPLTPLQAAIATAQSEAAPESISVSEATAAAQSTRLRSPAGGTPPPAAPPELAARQPGEPVCAVSDSASRPPAVTVGGSVEGLDQAVPTGSVTRDGVLLADRVYLPPGRAAVVRAVGAPDAGTGFYHLVTDLGVRHPVRSPDVLALLGYTADQAVDVPAPLVTRIPAGPTLDPAAAVLPAA